jgi:hypothetical protein
MVSRLTNFLNSVVITANSSRNLRHALGEFRACAEAEYAGLLEESGTVLMESGSLAHGQADIVGALANGAFIAVRELASRLGDDCCEGLYHQGRTKHFSIVPLSPVTTLITVFGNETKLGIVRSAVARYGPKLRDLLDDSTLAASAPASQEGDLILNSDVAETPAASADDTQLEPAPVGAALFSEANTPLAPVTAGGPTVANAIVFSPFASLPSLQEPQGSAPPS